MGCSASASLACLQKTKILLSGEGGLYAPARWTPQGFRAVYTAESLSLASLEVFVHTESNKIPLAIRALLPEDIAIETVVVVVCQPIGNKKHLSSLAEYW